MPATTAPQTFDIHPFPGSVGAQIIGLDLSRPVNDQDFARIHRQHLARLPGVAQMQSSFALRVVLQSTALPV